MLDLFEDELLDELLVEGDVGEDDVEDDERAGELVVAGAVVAAIATPALIMAAAPAATSKRKFMELSHCVAARISRRMETGRPST